MIIFYRQFYRIGSRRGGRRGGGRMVPRRLPLVIDDDSKLAYKEENWLHCRSLGESQYRIHRTNIAGVIPLGAGAPDRPDEVHDIRIVSPDDEHTIREYDDAIAELENERLQFIQDQFKTWRIPTKDDCNRVIEGTTKDEAARLATEANARGKPSDEHIQAERTTQRFLANAINSTGLYKDKGRERQRQRRKGVKYTRGKGGSQ